MYFQALSDAMTWLAEQGDTVFLGQAVEVPGTAMSNTLQQVDKAKLIEMPVAEEMQMGVSIGLAMAGTVPVSIFPRWNFLLLAVIGCPLDCIMILSLLHLIYVLLH